MLLDWTQERFEQALNSRFEIEIPGQGQQHLDLIAVTRYPASPVVVAFAALFRGTLEKPFGQGLYTIRHEHLGQTELFLVPVGREPDGFRYEAVFNRLLAPLGKN